MRVRRLQADFLAYALVDVIVDGSRPSRAAPRGGRMGISGHQPQQAMDYAHDDRLDTGTASVDFLGAGEGHFRWPARTPG